MIRLNQIDNLFKMNERRIQKVEPLFSNATIRDYLNE
jgi:hypothetical protein